MELPIYQVDAFTSRQFAGNPAAVCPLEEWIPEATMQAIAAENNLAETAFFVPVEPGRYRLRWFTPSIEVDLCGHATLASAFVLDRYLGFSEDKVQFESRGGELSVTREGSRFRLDFPALALERCPPPAALVEGLGMQPLEVFASMDYLAVLPSEADVRTVTPDYTMLSGLDRRGVIVTSRGESADFVSRFFAPGAGINEDPVTGSAHCALTPYWSRRLGKRHMHAMQVSKRGGELWLQDRGDRIWISGHCAPYLAGTITIAG
jgi:PhzF family phenazine biosynthesis protein